MESKKLTRKRIFEIIEIGEEGDTASRVYDFFMMITIIVSLIPLFFKEENLAFTIIDYVTVIIFIIDYILRLFTADYKLGPGAASFIKYPFTPMAIIDIVSILPTFMVISPGFKILKVGRLLRTLKVFRIFKNARYFKSIEMIVRVIKREKSSLLMVCSVAVGYIIICALVMFNVEPQTFNNFFDALYWSTVSLTTVGYGDIYAVSAIGKVFTMISALFGIAIVALPAGIISAGFVNEINERNAKRKQAQDESVDQTDDDDEDLV